MPHTRITIRVEFTEKSRSDHSDVLIWETTENHDMNGDNPLLYRESIIASLEIARADMASRIIDDPTLSDR